MAKRKKHSSKFKLQVVLESISKNEISEIARKYDINPNLVSRWKQILKDNGAMIFENKPEDLGKKYQKKIESLENLIGKKEVELNLIKKYLDFYAPESGN
jgi:putative transposase